MIYLEGQNYMSIYLATKSFKSIIDWRLKKIENVGQRIGRENWHKRKQKEMMNVNYTIYLTTREYC